MKTQWTELATSQFKHNQRYYSAIDRQIAKILAMRVNSAVRRLQKLPDVGRPGIRPGTREWVVQRSPYVIIYRVEEETLQILFIWHARQNRTVVE